MLWIWFVFVIIVYVYAMYNGLEGKYSFLKSENTKVLYTNRSSPVTIFVKRFFVCDLATPPGSRPDLQQVTHTREYFPETWLWTNTTAECVIHLSILCFFHLLYYLNWWKEKPPGSIAGTRKQQPWFYWSCSSVVMIDATPLTPHSAWAELHFQM